jgi:hypothetical protein
MPLVDIRHAASRHEGAAPLLTLGQTYGANMNSNFAKEMVQVLFGAVARILLASACATQAQADTPAWSNDFDRTVPSECTTKYWITGFNASYTDGWEVRVNVDARITALGIYDAGYSSIELPDPTNIVNPDGIGIPGVAVDTVIGMFNSSGQLLAQVVVPAGDSAELVDRIRYVPITPIDVLAGEHLTFARFADIADWTIGHDFESFPVLPNADYYYTDCWFRFSGDLTHIGGRYSPSSSLTYPSPLDDSVPYMLVGTVNFLYQVTNADQIFGDGFD